MSGSSSKVGAWIDSHSGGYSWVGDRGRWLNQDTAIENLGQSHELIFALGKLPWDLSGDASQPAIDAAMRGGLIRVRLSGRAATFEFKIPIDDAVLGAVRFMREQFEPEMICRFNSLAQGQSREFGWGRAKEPLSRRDLTFLTPYWMRAPSRSPVPAPWLLAESAELNHDLGVCGLDGDLALHELLDLVRPHVGPAGGWLGLADGRRWKLHPNTPPLVMVDQGGRLMGLELCPDCGWPRKGDVAPCKCWTRNLCKICSMPSFWPIPMHETITLDGQMLYVPHFAGYGHRCISWGSVRVVSLEDFSVPPG